MMRLRAVITALACLLASAAGAHPAPNSTLRLEFTDAAVRAEYWLPVSELGHARAAEPASALPDYLLRRLAVETPSGAAWRVAVRGIREDRYLEHDYLVADLALTPPRGAPLRQLVLVDDVITHEVRNHLLFVVQNLATGNQLVGTLQYPARRLAIQAR
jgi:hypothetical protein